MFSPVSISRTPAIAGQDFAALRAEGLRLIQQYAGAAWTDYNAHDPGVTTLEQLCYALTDLSYQSARPVADLWAAPDGRIDLRGHGLRAATRILPGGPVTASDLRKLLIDRTPGLANAWIAPADSPDGVRGLYDIQLYVPGGLDEDGWSRRADRLRRHAVRVFVRHRPLCEDLRRVSILRPARTVVSARLEIGGAAPPEVVMARILFALGLALAPEPRRRGLAEMLEDGRAPSRIFEGPSLRHGFIDEADLTPRPDTITWSSLVRTLAATTEVEAVDQLSVWMEGQVLTASRPITVPADVIPRLDDGLAGSVLPLTLMRRGEECRIDSLRVQRELARLWAGRRRRQTQSGDYDRAFPAPSAQPRESVTYVPVRTTYPGVYGIGHEGLPGDAGPARRAEARQFRGYLAMFDQLMADHQAQIAHAPDLFSLDPTSTRSYFHQPLDEPDILIGDPDPTPLDIDRALERRARFLDILLAVHGEVDQTPPDLDPAAVLARKRQQLRNLATDGRRRGRGLDYLGGAALAAGTEAVLRHALGFAVPESGGRPERFHLIEHVLLRAGRRRRRGRPFDYDLTVSAVFNLSRAERTDPRRRAHLTRIVEAHIPAHVAVQVRFVNADWRLDFDLFHHAWRTALRSRRPRPIILTSIALRELLLDLPMEKPE